MYRNFVAIYGVIKNQLGGDGGDHDDSDDTSNLYCLAEPYNCTT
jgi:hypothetical protein